jgi:hypothetical protein
MVVDGIGGNGDTLRHTLAEDSVVADTSRDKMHFVSPKTGRDTFELENFFYDWQYQNLDLDKTVLPLDSLMTISPIPNSLAPMLPSLDVNLSHARIWCTVYDFFMGSFNRPTAFTFRQADVYFKYTDAYKNRKKK